MSVDRGRLRALLEAVEPEAQGTWHGFPTGVLCRAHWVIHNAPKHDENGDGGAVMSPEVADLVAAAVNALPELLDASDEGDEAFADLLEQRTSVAEELESLREQYGNAGHDFNDAKYLRYRAAEALAERDDAREDAATEHERACHNAATASRAMDEVERLTRERDEARAEVERLRADLHEYGCHSALCGIVGGYGECTCGYSAARGEP